MSEPRQWDKNEILKDHERLQAIVREKRQKQEARRRAEAIRLKNWSRSDNTIRTLEVIVNDKF